MKSKDLFKILFTVFAVLSIICIVLPFVQTDFWGMSYKIAVIDLFNMEFVEEALNMMGEPTTFFQVAKGIFIGLVVLDLIGIFALWFWKKAGAFIGGLVGLLEVTIYGICIWAILAEGSEAFDLGSMFGVDFSIGVGAWGHIIAGIGMLAMAICTIMRKPESASISKADMTAEGALVGISGEYAGACIPVSEEPLIIGREQSSCHLILPGEHVSRRHCSIVYDKVRKIYIVKDFSSNGTYLEGGKRLSSQQSNEVASGEQIRIGKNVFELR